MQNKRILIIDDNPAIHRDYIKILGATESRQTAAEMFLQLETVESEECEFELVMASQGQEGVDLARRGIENGKPFSVAFVDMRMPPGMDGLETTVKLWEVDPDIQVVICTAYSDHSLGQIRAALKRNDQFLLLKKPFDSVEVSQLATALSEKWRLTLEEKRSAAEKAKRLELAEDSLSKHTLFLELATKIAGTGYCNVDPVSRQLTVSDHFCKILGRDKSKLETLESFLDLVIESDRDRIRNHFDLAFQAKEGANFLSRASIFDSNNELKHLQLSFVFEKTIANEQGCLFGVIHDISESVKALEAVKRAALHDPLTGLPNREKMMIEFDSAIKRSKRSDISTGLVLMDVDHFKSINDSYGHPAGDQLLQQVANRIQDNIRETDTVSRLGGDEFALVHSSQHIPQDTMSMLDRIYEAFEEPFEIDGKQLFASLSSGISLAPLNGLDLEQLIKFADLALYRAKQEGRGCYRFFDEELDQKMKDRRSIEQELGPAVENGEFQLYYQPIINCLSKKIGCMEALIRWNHPQRGFIAPDKFISIAEDTGDIVSIGQWVLEQACSDAVKWPEHINVSVNVSAVQFRKTNFFDSVLSVLKKTGLAPERLEIEITERVILGHNTRILESLNDLRDLGVRIVMDDFGVGYSSLSYLQQFRFDKLKLDRSFLPLDGMTEQAEVIIRTMAGLGKSLKMATCAEGVETWEQFERVQKEGYSQAQGFLFSKPKPIEEFEEVLQSDSLLGLNSSASN